MKVYEMNYIVYEMIIWIKYSIKISNEFLIL